MPSLRQCESIFRKSDRHLPKFSPAGSLQTRLVVQIKLLAQLRAPSSLGPQASRLQGRYKTRPVVQIKLLAQLRAPSSLGPQASRLQGRYKTRAVVQIKLLRYPPNAGETPAVAVPVLVPVLGFNTSEPSTRLV